MKRLSRIALTLISLALTLACFASCFAEIKEPEWGAYDEEATIVWWAWCPCAEEMVEEFNKVYPNIHVEYQNVGSGNDLYTKLMTVMTAGGQGAPDVAQIEFQVIPQFVDAGYLEDVSEYANQYEEYFEPWTWKQVKVGDAVYAIPQDGGPLGLFYQPEAFAEYGLEPAKTYEQMAEDARALHAANPDVWYMCFPINEGSIITGILWQDGWHPFHYDEASDTWEIAINTTEAKEVLNYWGSLIDEGAVKAVNYWTPEWGSDFSNNVFLSFIGAAWSPVTQLQPYMTETTGTYNVALLPQWDVDNPSNGNWGGSTMAITSATQNAEAATIFAAWLNCSEYALKSDVVPDGRGLFPAGIYGYELEEFNAPDPILNDQLAAPIWVEAMQQVDTSFEWSPWTSYFFDELVNEFSAAYNKSQSWNDVLDNLQEKIVTYAENMGYNIAK